MAKVAANRLLFIIVLSCSVNLFGQVERVARHAVGPTTESTIKSGRAITPASVPDLEAHAFSKIRFVQSTDNWSVGGLAIPLTESVQATVTIPIGPVGVDTGGVARFGGPWGQYQVRIVDGGMSETVYVTGGTCESGKPRCTLIFTPHFSHVSSAYTLGSATHGIQEAINDACGLANAAHWYRNGKCHVLIPPISSQGNSAYNIYGTIFFHTNNSRLSGYGAELNCYGRGPCLVVGYLMGVNLDGTAIAKFPAGAPTNLSPNNVIEGIEFRNPTNLLDDPAYAGSLVSSTQYVKSSGTNTITTSKPHNLRTGDMVMIMFTDNNNYWGDVPSVVVTGPNSFTYHRNRHTDIPLQKTPGAVALAYEAILDNAQNTRFSDISRAPDFENGRFNQFFDFWDDENAVVDHYDGGALNGNLNWSGSHIWSGGARNLPGLSQQLAPVITLRDSSITANGSNCATVYNSNGLYVYNTVCQGQGPWQFYVSSTTGNYHAAHLENVYSESSLRLNPLSPAMSPFPGTGVAGLIQGMTSFGSTLEGGIGDGNISGLIASYGTGPIIYDYYIVGRDTSAGTSTAPMLAMQYKSSTGSETPILYWPRLSHGSHVIQYDIIRTTGNPSAAAGGYIAPYKGGCGGGSPTTCGSVATGLSQCAGLTCSYTDNLAGNTFSYTNLGGGTFDGNVIAWPGTAVVQNRPITTDKAYSVQPVGMGNQVVQYATYCANHGVSLIAPTACLGSRLATNNAVPNQSATFLTDGGSSGGGMSQSKGRLNFWASPDALTNRHHIITLVDSNPRKTINTTTWRPPVDANDTYIGLDNREVNYNKAQLAFGAPVSISNYIANAGDDSNWNERLTAAAKLFRLPVEFQPGIAYEISGPEVSRPPRPIAGFQRAYFKAQSGLCAIDSAGVERCTGTEGSIAVPDTPDMPWFTAAHVAGKATVFPNVPSKAAFFGVVLTFSKITTQLTYSVGTPDSSSTNYDIGIYSGSSGGKCVLLAHTGPVPGSTSMTLGFHTVKWVGGTITLNPGRYYLAITASAITSLAALGGETAQLTFAGGQSPETVGNVTETRSGTLDETSTCPKDSYSTAVVPAFAVN